MTPQFLPATVLTLASHGRQLRLHLDVVGAPPCELDLEVPAAAGHALAHIHALHGHTTGCRGQVDVHVDLLLRCCRLLGGGQPRLLVRGGTAPAFWLEVTTPAGEQAHVDVGTLDAVVLLASRRVPVGVQVGAEPVDAGQVESEDWDAALRRLLDDG
ncbi:hypothetical protein [Euzebya sp.]|uniref:hypothetical protein n=1 Tax=Euzebya sp. TaxID=1971409 RepID=UPI0035147A45